MQNERLMKDPLEKMSKKQSLKTRNKNKNYNAAKPVVLGYLELQTYGSSNSSKNISNDTKISAEKITSTEETEVRSDIMVDCTSHFTVKQVRDIGRANGFVIVIRTSDYGGGIKRLRIYLACERSGKYRSRKKLKDGSKDLLKQTGTKKCECPFDLKAYKLKTNDEWILNVVCRLHNHPAAEHLQGHSSAGRLSANEKSLLVDMSKSLTNRYRLPLLEIVGVTLTHMTFSEAIAYLQTERVDNYAWALQTLRDLMDDSVLPEVIVIDRELTVMNAIDNTFPNAQHLVESAHARLKRQLGSSQTTFEISFKKIHCLLELQHIQVKASFEKSLTTMQHQFKPSQFGELRGNVSICALEYALAESKRANLVRIDVAACGCVLRHTHGLPCAHKIADYMRQGRPIPLSSIHVHWTRLTICVHNLKVEKLELTCIPELEMILKRFNESDIAIKLDMLKKLKEIANPASTFLIEPDVKPNPRRGHKKTNISCRRDPCAFELVDNGHDSQSTLASSQSKKKKASKVLDKKRNVKTKTYCTRTSLPSAYAGDFPPMLIPFIKLMKDVDGDGNCGFKAIAGLLGLGENDWVQVRRDLLLELNNYRDEYVVLYRLHERVEELTYILSYFEDSAGFDRWMTMPDMGHLIASFYNVVLYHLSLQQCLTFLPLRSPPVTLTDRREITIGFVNGNHFVQVFLKAGHPVPPIAVLWRVHHHTCASEWENAYVSRIQKFKDSRGPNVATRETFDVVDID
ncbi:uncharacterized protein LOC114287276 [Camellia sinensis]|uniref:uncharacterized protein LOC114287276 n=1 Tax=Camellia sinensis TaxID=4442 RepID=UPI001036CA92|nr:uncharacterized protein LOC114287276 [Camellia sinensis]